ncbi:TMEM175 family protein [Klenkia soli]|uniref:TMEM175 family protein n=1 Tax=Klenkia soli TaxID=1052260 RepID=UPI000B862201|nr:TMEM175 family protein [Klenkia soli]
MTAPHRTERGLDRFATFVDAVVAIAITLLVLPLVDVATEREPGQSVGELLGDHLGQFGAFALSFVVIARLWLLHHAVFERVAAYDPVVVRTSLVWVFTIVVLPFPTELLPLADGGRTVFALYVGDLTLSSLALTVLVLHVARTPAVQRAGLVPWPSAAPSVAATALFAVALVLGLLVPAIGFWGLLLQFASGPAVRAWEHRRPRMA